MRLISEIKLDIKANKGNPKGKIISSMYRIANYYTTNKKNNLLLRIIGYPYIKIYRSLFYWWWGIEIPDRVKIGKGLQIWHGFGIVINSDVQAGDNLLLRHCTTIGNKFDGSKCPIIGDNVDIGAHTIIIGDIIIGDNVTIGAGSVVTKSIPPYHIAYGNPIKIIPKRLDI